MESFIGTLCALLVGALGYCCVKWPDLAMRYLRFAAVFWAALALVMVGCFIGIMMCVNALENIPDDDAPAPEPFKEKMAPMWDLYETIAKYLIIYAVVWAVLRVIAQVCNKRNSLNK